MTATADAPAVKAAEKPPLFGKQGEARVLDPLWDDNPIALQVLGICSALAVTVQGWRTTLVDVLAVIFVLCMSNTDHLAAAQATSPTRSASSSC